MKNETLPSLKKLTVLSLIKTILLQSYIRQRWSAELVVLKRILHLIWISHIIMLDKINVIIYNKP